MGILRLAFYSVNYDYSVLIPETFCLIQNWKTICEPRRLSSCFLELALQLDPLRHEISTSGSLQRQNIISFFYRYIGIHFPSSLSVVSSSTWLSSPRQRTFLFDDFDYIGKIISIIRQPLHLIFDKSLLAAFRISSRTHHQTLYTTFKMEKTNQVIFGWVRSLSLLEGVNWSNHD